MPVKWKKADQRTHETLAKRTTATKDPEWSSIMGELAAGSVVQIEYGDDKERGTLSRSVGRRAAHMGFKVDIRHGEGFISVRKAG